MAVLDFFLVRKNRTANFAKKRLQIIIAEQRKNNNEPDYIFYLKKDILKVISKYTNISPNMINIKLDKIEKNISILECNITLSKRN
ncbi:MAG TPA: cell division topological specificity factor MinE [Buchnera sp. (in: enterobacteria)]|nr:cell division topological specificity factor MinE [Buchnera sp. (in: enterobacteria)]